MAIINLINGIFPSQFLVPVDSRSLKLSNFFCKITIPLSQEPILCCVHGDLGCNFWLLFPYCTPVVKISAQKLCITIKHWLPVSRKCFLTNRPLWKTCERFLSYQFPIIQYWECYAIHDIYWLVKHGILNRLQMDFNLSKIFLPNLLQSLFAKLFYHQWFSRGPQRSLNFVHYVTESCWIIWIFIQIFLFCSEY